MEVLLCSQCKREGKYIIPICTRNKETNEIEFKCYKHNILYENNIFYCKLTNKLKTKLRECEIHKNEIYCAWCDKCEKNLCQICLGDEFKKKHDYILYNFLLKKDYNNENIRMKINNLKSYLKEIKIYYSNIKKYEKEIKIFENIIKYLEEIYNLFFKENIINYQTVLNLVGIIRDNYKKYESIFDNRYNVFISFIKGKDFDNISNREIIIPDKALTNILILNSKLNNDNEDINLESSTNKILLILSLNKILIYDMNGNIINSINNIYIKLSSDFNNMIQYKSNIILFFKKKAIFFLIFSNDFKDYEFTEDIDLSKFYINFSHDLPNLKTLSICTFRNENKIFKIDKNRIAIFYEYKLYIFELNNNLIFKDKKYYYNNKNNIFNLGSEKLQLIEKTKEFFESKNYYNYDIIPIYNINCENKGINKILFVNFIGNFEYDTKINEKLKLQGGNIKIDHLGNKLIYNESRIHLSENKYSIVFDTENLISFYSTFYEYCKNKCVGSEKDFKNIINKIKISVQMEDNEKLFRFCFTRKDILYLLKSNINECNILFSYSKNYILFLFNNNIYQINYKNGELIIIYELDNNLKLEQNYILNQIYYYNKELTKIEELYLLKLKEDNINNKIKDFNLNNIDKKNEREKLVFPYFWDSFELKSIKPFQLPNFDKIIQLKFFETFKSELKDSLNMERLLVNNDSVIIFK